MDKKWTKHVSTNDRLRHLDTTVDKTYETPWTKIVTCEQKCVHIEQRL